MITGRSVHCKLIVSIIIVLSGVETTTVLCKGCYGTTVANEQSVTTPEFRFKHVMENPGLTLGQWRYIIYIGPLGIKSAATGSLLS